MPKAQILIAGGGVAAVEAIAALRTLVGPLPHITVLAPGTRLKQRQMSVATPFGFGAPRQVSLADVGRQVPFELRTGTLVEVEVETHTATTDWGERISYDILIVAVGAQPRPAVEGAITFTGHAESAAVATAVEESERIAFVQPLASAWSLPIYELAIMAAVERRAARITLVTAEPSPLWIFGDEAGAAVGALLEERGIALRTGVRALAAKPGWLELENGTALAADRVVALPRMVGPAIPGLPHDCDGFIPVDGHGLVQGVADVFAAGDATAFPLKQGGLAAQQADAVAEAIAARLGAPVVPEPFRPVLRGLLLTGGAPLYLRAGVGGGTGVSRRPLWWPPAKVAGRYLAPLLATARPPVLGASPLRDLPERP